MKKLIALTIFLILASFPFPFRSQAQERPILHTSDLEPLSNAPTPAPTRTPTPTLTPSPIIGEQKTLVIMFNFQDQPDNKPFSKEEVYLAFFTGVGSLNSYYKEFSFNQLWFTGEVVGWYTIPYNTSCSWPENMRQILLEKVKADGVNVDDYSHLVYLKPYIDGCNSTASLGGDPSEMYLVGTLSPSLLIHEMGHNLSLGYAASLSCGSKAIDSYSNCQVNYYGDEFSPQGAMRIFHHNAFHKLSLGWLSPSRVQEVTTNRDYTIYPIETAGSGIQVLKIRKPNTNENYFLEYRRPIGFDSNLPHNVTSGALLHIGFYSHHPSSAYCELIHCSEYAINTYLIDTHPETPNFSGDAALSDGTTFYDEINNITITQLSHDENSVTVSVELIASASPTPTLTPSLTPTPTPIPPPSFFLSPGWNQITWPDVSNYTAKNALEDIDPDCGAGTAIAIARKRKDFWEEYVAGFGGKNFNLQSGQNYFINVSKNCNWTP